MDTLALPRTTDLTIFRCYATHISDVGANGDTKENQSFTIQSTSSFKDMVARIHARKGDQFWLTEILSTNDQLIEYKFFLNIGIKFDMKVINNCIKAICALTNDEPKLRIAINDITGKAHIVTNIKSDVRNFSAYLEYVVNYLNTNVDHGLTSAEFKSAFIDSTCLRSIYSIEKINGIVQPGRYLPEGVSTEEISEDLVKYLEKYSIHILDPMEQLCSWNEKTLQSIEEKKYKNAIVNDKIEIFGKQYELDDSLLDKVVSCIPMWFSTGTRTQFILSCVRNFATLVYDPTQFLREFGFHIEDWNNLEPNREKRSYSIVSICDIAVKYNPLKLKSKLRVILSPILDPNHRVYFADYASIPYETDINVLNNFVYNTIAIISNAGNILIVTKDISTEGPYFAFIDQDRAYRKWKRIKWQTGFESTKTKAGALVNTPIITTLDSVVMYMSSKITYARFEFVPNLDYVVKLDFIPDRQVSYKSFNTYTGLISEHDFEFGPLDKYQPLIPIIYHIEHIICDGNPELYAYILHWLARLVHRPHDRNIVALVIRSVEGAGKTSFWNWIGKCVLGSNYYVEASMDQITQKFNSITRNILLTVFEETGKGKGTEFHEELKKLITNDDLLIELKGVEIYKTKNYSNYVVLTNEDNAVKVTTGDRRYACFEASDKHIGDVPYWDKLRALYNLANGRLFYEMLSVLDLDKWNRNKIPKTQMRENLKVRGMSSTIKFLIAVLQGEVIDANWDQGKIWTTARDFYRVFLSWCGENGIFKIPANTTLGQDISRIYPGSLTKTTKAPQVRGYSFVRSELLQGIRKEIRDPDFDKDVEYVDNPMIQSSTSEFTQN